MIVACKRRSENKTLSNSNSNPTSAAGPFDRDEAQRREAEEEVTQKPEGERTDATARKEPSYLTDYPR
jgi:hypothetical protein